MSDDYEEIWQGKNIGLRIDSESSCTQGGESREPVAVVCIGLSQECYGGL